MKPKLNQGKILTLSNIWMLTVIALALLVILGTWGVLTQETAAKTAFNFLVIAAGISVAGMLWPKSYNPRTDLAKSN